MKFIQVIPIFKLSSKLSFLFPLILACILSFTFISQSQGKKIQLSQAQEIQFKNLANNLRCVVCNNESIYQSDTPIANNIRELIRTRIQQGQQPIFIKDYLHKRYGDVILLTPPFNKNTFAFWLIIAIILLFLASVIVLVGYMTIKSKNLKYTLSNDITNNSSNISISDRKKLNKHISNNKMLIILLPMIIFSSVVFLILFVKLEVYTSYKSINSFKININKIQDKEHLSKSFCENPSIELTALLMGKKRKIKVLVDKCLQDYPDNTYVKNLRNTLN